MYSFLFTIFDIFAIHNYFDDHEVRYEFWLSLVVLSMNIVLLTVNVFHCLYPDFYEL